MHDMLPTGWSYLSPREALTPSMRMGKPRLRKASDLHGYRVPTAQPWLPGTGPASGRAPTAHGEPRLQSSETLPPVSRDPALRREVAY